MRSLLLFVILSFVLNNPDLLGQCQFPLSLDDKLEARFRADDYLPLEADTTLYQEWTDLSGNGNHFVSAANQNEMPSFIPEALNGRGALFLDGDDEMVIENQLQVGSAYVIYSWDGAIPFDDFKGLLVRPIGPGSFRLFFGQNGETSFWPSGFFGSNYITNNVETLDIQNTETFNATYAYANEPGVVNELLLGRDFSTGNRSWNGKVLELAIFNAELTTEEFGSLKTYVQCHYTPIPELPDTIFATNFCPIEIDVERDYFKSYLWSTGATSPVLEVTKSGAYGVELVTIFNDTLSSEMAVEFPGNIIEDFNLCVGSDSLWNTALDEFDVVWQDGSTSPDYLINAEGEYYFVASDQSGCTYYSDSIYVQTDNFSQIMEIDMDTVFCVGNQLSLAVGSESAQEYVWSNGSNEASVTPVADGDVWVEVINENGCFGRDTVTVEFAGEAPQADFVSDLLCAQVPVEFSDSSFVIDDSEITDVQWIIGNDTLIGEEVSYYFDSAGYYMLGIDVLTTVGCTGMLRDTIFVNPIPDISTVTSLACTNQLTLFEDQSTIPQGSIVGWLWDFGNGDTANTPEATAVFSNPGIAQVTLTAESSEGCTATDQVQVPVYPTPEAGFNWSATCEGDFMLFESTTDTGLTGTVNYAWNLAGVIDSGESVDHQFPGAGSYEVSHEVWTTISGSPGCFDEVFQDVVVSAPPNVQFEHSVACAGQDFVLTDATEPGNNDEIISWQWNASGNLIDTMPNTSYSFDEVGSYAVSLEVMTEAGCNGEFTDMVDVGFSESPQIDFSPEIGLPPLSVDFVNTTSIGQGHFWYFGDENSSNLESPTHTYTDTGYFQVEVTVFDEAGCFGYDSATVLVIEPLFDVSVESVTCELHDGQLAVSCVIGNYNNHRLTSAELQMTIGNGTVVSEFWEGDLAKNQLTTFSFQSQLNYDPEINDPFVCVEISNPNGASFDRVPENNEMCKPFGGEPFELFSPFPNPATDIVSIFLSLERSSKLSIQLVQADGRVMEEREVDFSAGLNEIQFNTDAMSAGVYLIGVEWNNEWHWRKLLINRN